MRPAAFIIVMTVSTCALLINRGAWRIIRLMSNAVAIAMFGWIAVVPVLFAMLPRRRAVHARLRSERPARRRPLRRCRAGGGRRRAPRRARRPRGVRLRPRLGRHGGVLHGAQRGRPRAPPGHGRRAVRTQLHARASERLRAAEAVLVHGLLPARGRRDGRRRERLRVPRAPLARLVSRLHAAGQRLPPLR